MHRTKRLSRDHRHGPTSVHDRVLSVGHPHSVSLGVSGSNHNIAASSSCETDRFLFTRCRWTSLHFHYRWDCYVGAKSWLFLEPLLSQFAVDVYDCIGSDTYMTRVLFGCSLFWWHIYKGTGPWIRTCIISNQTNEFETSPPPSNAA